MKFLKHSARLFLHVMLGSKRIWLLFSLAIMLAAFRWGVSEKLPCCEAGVNGFILGSIKQIRMRASLAHWCGFVQPSCLSLSQSRHSHVGVGWWGRSGRGVCILSAVLSRSITKVILCRRRRHLAGAVVIGW